MTLKFSKAAHRYTMDGKSVSGVTTILGKALPKPAIPYWAAKSVAEWVTDNPEGLEQLRKMGRAPMVEALKNVPWEKRDVAAINGTDVHALAEKLIFGEKVDVPTHLVKRVEGLATLLDDFSIHPLLTEVSVGNRKLWYAGRLDTISVIDDENWLLDFKTSAGVYGETGLQCAAYASAEFPVLGLMFADDELLLEDGARMLHAAYTGRPADYRLITPAEFGLKRIGHFGFFKPQSEAALWPEVTKWIDERSTT